MSAMEESSERRRWNEKYRLGEHSSLQPSALLEGLDTLLPRSGRALELAGGVGRNALWLARRGLQVTLADISDVALKVARNRFAQQGLLLETLQIDLEQEPFPQGPWDLVLSVHFLWRPLFQILPSVLVPAGRFVCIQPTRSNLERHAKPPARFLLDDGELPRLAAGMEILKYEEGWLAEGRHEALLVARRRTSPT